MVEIRVTNTRRHSNILKCFEIIFARLRVIENEIKPKTCHEFFKPARSEFRNSSLHRRSTHCSRQKSITPFPPPVYSAASIIFRKWNAKFPARTLALLFIN